jgi:hypothetical protein
MVKNPGNGARVEKGIKRGDANNLKEEWIELNADLACSFFVERAGSRTICVDVWPWESHFTSLSLRPPIYTMAVMTSSHAPLTGLVWGVLFIPLSSCNSSQIFT